jgi:parvulin-like peptidyl-prolyl isomerase
MNQLSHPILRRLLMLGIGLGVTLVGYGLIRGGQPVVSPDSVALEEDVLATVNGVAIRVERFAQMVATIEHDRRGQALDGEQRRWLLDQVIADELLLQRALTLGLARADALVRRRLVAALVESITAEASELMPDEAALHKFYYENPQYFRRGVRVELERIFVRSNNSNDAQAQQRAEAARVRLRNGESLTAVQAAFGDEPDVALPSGLLAPEKIREYLGPTAARTAQELEPGAVSKPVRVSGGYEVMRVTRQEAGGVAPFDTVRDSVIAEYRRSAAAAALKKYIEELRAAAEIQVNEAALAATARAEAQE